MVNMLFWQETKRRLTERQSTFQLPGSQKICIVIDYYSINIHSDLMDFGDYQT
jgi:hypothetical protein